MITSSGGNFCFRHVIWLVGQQCAGKTHYARVMRAFGAQVLNIGEALRAQHTVSEFSNSDNAYAPVFTEETAQDLIRKNLYDFSSGTHELDMSGTLVIDSAPRNEGQLAIMGEFFDLAHTLMFIMEDYSVRRERARQKYGNDLTFFEKREAFETEWLAHLWGLALPVSAHKIILPGTRYDV